MFNHQSWLRLGCCVAVLALGACTTKEIPQGTRIAVLEAATTLKPDVADGAGRIQTAASVDIANWLQPDVNAQHVIPNAKIGVEFQRQWKSDFGAGASKREILMAKPLVKGNVLYTLDADGALSAFNLADGEKLWRVELMSENKYAVATSMKGVGLTMQNDTIFITMGFGSVVAVKAKDGTKIWEQNLRAPLRIAPTYAAGKVFVQNINNRFFALDALNGEILWDYDIAMENTTLVGGASAAYSPALDVAITGFSNGEIQAFGATIGTPLWSDNLVANRQAYSSTALHTVKASPVVEGETVYALGTADVLTAIDIRSGSRRWEKEIGGTQTPLLSGNTLFVVANTHDLVALDKSNGNILWATALNLGKKADDITVYAPIMLNDRLLVTLSDGRVMLFDAKSGKKINELDLKEDFNSAPIVAQGYVLFTTRNAKIIAYK
ncbi:MAG: PQQ-binding-like beta-propeller repeat protein [Alphaproteobacteria bacterium]|nr:PQQ-binding-like beta-propeller repeat protein [Alphaproteobacteria bacterium]